MNSVAIDTILKPVQPATPVKSPSAAAGPGGEFDDYLRGAAATQQPPAKEPAQKKSQPTGDSTSSTGHEQHSASSADDDHTSTVPNSEDEEVLIDEAAAVEADEVLLSVAAVVVADVPTEIVAAEEVATMNVAVISAAPAVEPAAFETNKQTATATDVLAAEVAASETTPAASTLVHQAGAEATLEPTAAPSTSDAAKLAADVVGESNSAQSFGTQSAEAAAQAPVDMVTQVVVAAATTTPLTLKVDATTEATAGEKSDHAEAKSAKVNAVEQPALAHQLAGEVAAVLESELSRESTHNMNGEARSPELATAGPANSQPIQRATESGQGYTPRLPDDHDAPVPTVDRARFVQRVANAFRSAHQNDGHIQLRLSPPELGSLRIEIAVRNGVLSANLETETSDARRVLLDNLPALRQRLAEQDIRIDKFEVDIRREGGQPDGQAGAQDRQAQQQSQRAAAQNRIPKFTTPEVSGARIPRASSISADSGLDVRI